MSRLVVPSWDRRGGCASRKYREAPLKAQTGWSCWTDHPVRAFLTFDGAATPPVPGGDYLPYPDGAHSSLLIFILLLTGCRQQMADQPRYDPYDESTFFPDRLSARPLPMERFRTISPRNELLDAGHVNGKARRSVSISDNDGRAPSRPGAFRHLLQSMPRLHRSW